MASKKYEGQVIPGYDTAKQVIEKHKENTPAGRKKRKTKEEEEARLRDTYAKKPDGFAILPVKDGFEDQRLSHWLWDLPFIVALVGKSKSSGKTTWLTNMLARIYSPSPWKGENIFVISGSAESDKKIRLIQQRLGIPDENIYSRYSESLLTKIYQIVKERHIKKPKERYLIVLDDIATHLKPNANSGILSKIGFEGRHELCSVILSSQKYSMIPSGFRENLSGAVIWGCAERQLRSIADDLNRLESPKLFKDMVRSCTDGGQHNFMVIRPNRALGEMYLDSNFKPVLPQAIEEKRSMMKRKSKKVDDDSSSESETEDGDTYLPLPKKRKEF